MHDGVDARERGVKGVRVTDVPLDQLGVYPGQVSGVAGRVVVEHANPLPRRDKLADQRCADEPGAAGHQDPAFLLHG